MGQIERRCHARRPLERPVKLRCVHSGRYMAGRIKDISDNGALLEICQPSLLVPGQEVEIGIVWDRRKAVLDSDHMLKGSVVRSLGMGGTQHVAIQFEHTVTLQATA